MPTYSGLIFISTCSGEDAVTTPYKVTVSSWIWEGENGERSLLYDDIRLNLVTLLVDAQDGDGSGRVVLRTKLRRD